jgi:hypothetical protein
MTKSINTNDVYTNRRNLLQVPVSLIRLRTRARCETA